MIKITAKFIDEHDLKLAESIIRSNPKNPNGIIMGNEEIDRTLARYKSHLQDNTMKLVVVSKNNSPYALYAAFYVTSMAGYIIHGPRVAQSNLTYYATANTCSVGLDLLIEHMEKNLYFKFWQIDIGNRHLRRKLIMDKFSKYLTRYDWYDEIFVPNQDSTGFSFYDNLIKSTTNSADINIRLFTLQQEFRKPFIEKYYEHKVNSSR